MKFKIKKVVEIELDSLPDQFKNKLTRDQYYVSAIMPYGNEDWSDVLDIEKIKNWYIVQSERQGYKGIFDRFIVDYKLEFEKYLIDEKMHIHLSGVKEIVLV